MIWCYWIMFGHNKYVMKVEPDAILLSVKDITQWWTLVELFHEIIAVKAIHMVRPCSTDHFS